MGSWQQCTKCQIYKLECEFSKNGRGGNRTICRSCEGERKNLWDIVNKEKILYRLAKRRAGKLKIKFNIKVDDIVIPDICPVLKIPIYRDSDGLCANSPSLDRIDPNKGYVKGNVRVISFRANTLKNNATMRELTMLMRDARNLYTFKNT
jgi:hypothetical protein